ncbi:hypothetical protein BS78_05G252400 [Paspalum vaginatum]|nr:hypothetical protein BS78_05G252400 [Paspalum vaginatum]
MSIGALPENHESCQKLAFRPLPTVTTVEARKRAASVLSQGIKVPAHGLLESVQLYHNHRIRKARLKRSRSRIPSPPNDFGLAALVQFTGQCPPFALSEPLHRKDLMILSTFLITHFFKGKTVMKWTGMAESTEFTRVSLSALSSNFPFQADSFPASLSSKGRKSTLRNGLQLRGSPRYLYGKDLISHGKGCMISSSCKDSQQMG